MQRQKLDTDVPSVAPDDELTSDGSSSQSETTAQASVHEIAEVSPKGASPQSKPSASVASSASLPFVHAGATAPSVAYLRIKPGNFSRLLYTNPVCLLTSSARPPLALGADLVASVAATANTAAIALPSLPAASESAASTAAADSTTPSSLIGPPRNVMTISWLTATSNHGEFMMSMHAGRYSATFVHAVGDRFVLNVPVKGMEELVKQIGACSGRDDVAQDKFTRLGIRTCRPGNKPSTSLVAQTDGKLKQKTRSPALQAEDDADAEDAEWNFLAIPSCVAHLVCEVTSVHPVNCTDTAGTGSQCPFLFSSPRLRTSFVLAEQWVKLHRFTAGSATIFDLSREWKLCIRHTVNSIDICSHTKVEPCLTLDLW